MSAGELAFWCVWAFFEAVGVGCFLLALSLSASLEKRED